jgi:hypothetical protein
MACDRLEPGTSSWLVCVHALASTMEAIEMTVTNLTLIVLLQGRSFAIAAPSSA